MALQSTQKFSIQDLLPEADLFCNSGLPVACPACGRRNLYNWRCRIFEFDFLWCPDPSGEGKDGCGFFGNIVDLYMKVHGRKSYYQTLMRFDEATDDLRASRGIFERQERVSETLTDARRELKAKVHTAERLLSMHGCNIRLAYAPAIARRIGILSQRIMEESAWLPTDYHEMAPCICIPFWVFPKLVTRMLLLGEKDVKSYYVLADSGVPVQKEGGICDFSDGKEKMLVTTDLDLAFRFLRLHQILTYEATAPLALIDPATSRSCLDIVRKDRVLFAVSAQAQRAVEEFSGSSATRFVRGSVDLEGSFQRSAPGEIMDTLLSDSFGFSDFVRELAADDSEMNRKTLESLRELELNSVEIDGIIGNALPIERKRILDAWRIPSSVPIVVAANYMYRRLEDGGIEQIRRSKESAKQIVADVDFREDGRLKIDDAVVHCGHLRYQGKDISFKISRDLKPSQLSRQISKTVLGARFKSAPMFSGIQMYKWLDICIKFGPNEPKKGSWGVELSDDERFILPGRVISAEKITVEDLIGTDYGQCNLPKISWKINRMEQLFHDTQMAHAYWTVITAFATTFLARMFRADATPLVFIGDSAGLMLVDEICKAFDIPSSMQVDGFPFRSKQPEPFSILAGSVFDAHIIGSMSLAHFAFIPRFGQVPCLNLKSACNFLLRSVRHYLRSDMLQLEAPTACYCERCLDLLEQYLQQEGLSTDNLIKGAFNLRCGNLSRRLLLSRQDEDIEGFLSLMHLLCEYGPEGDFYTMLDDDAVSINLSNVGVATERRCRELGVSLDLYEVHRKLHRNKMFLGGGGDEVRIEKAAWDKSRENWRSSCLRWLR